MQVPLLKIVVASISGPQSTGVVDLLYGKKNVNEFLISKKLKLTINQTRNILYKLADEGLVSFIRKKDSKKGGWYTYFWTLNSGKSLVKFQETLSRNLEQIKQQLELRKQGRFYVCKYCHKEFNEENALLQDYICPECGEVLEVKDMIQEINSMEKEITKLEDALANVNEEVYLLSASEEKVRHRKLQAEARKKKKERAERQLARKKLSKSVGSVSKKISKTKIKKSSKKKGKKRI